MVKKEYRSRLSFIAESERMDLKYLCMFYELAKMGIIRFDLRDQTQLTLFAKMLVLSKSYDPEKYKNETLAVQLDEKNKFDMYQLIMVELFKYAIT